MVVGPLLRTAAGRVPFCVNPRGERIGTLTKQPWGGRGHYIHVSRHGMYKGQAAAHLCSPKFQGEVRRGLAEVLRNPKKEIRSTTR